MIQAVLLGQLNGGGVALSLREEVDGLARILIKKKSQKYRQKQGTVEPQTQDTSKADKTSQQRTLHTHHVESEPPKEDDLSTMDKMAGSERVLCLEVPP